MENTFKLLLFIFSISLFSCNTIDEDTNETFNSSNLIVERSNTTVGNPFENDGEVHNAIVAIVLERAKKNFDGNQNLEETMQYVSNEIIEILSNEDFLNSYNLERDDELVNQILSNYLEQPFLFGVEECIGCVNFELFAEYYQKVESHSYIFDAIKNSNNASEVLNRLERIESDLLTQVDSQERNEALYVISIGKSSAQFAILNSDNFDEYIGSRAFWEEVVVSDMLGAYAGLAFVGVGAGGGAALFSAVTALTWG